MLDQAKQICITLLQGKTNPSNEDINEAISGVLKLYPGLVLERETIFKFLEAQFSVFSDGYQILDDPETYTPWLKNKKADINWEFWKRYAMYLQKKIEPITLNN